MLFIKPLSTVTPNELQAVGYRAQDLATITQQQVPTPPSFIVLTTAYDELLRINNIKYKIDYILGHAQPEILSSMTNVYSGVRKAMLEAKLPNGFETELREMYETVSAPPSFGELVASNERVPTRLILSANRIDDPESNDTIIQNVNSFEELLLGLREAWALAYHPSQLGARMRERFPESHLKLAIIVQAMEMPHATCVAYSCLPQDHHKIYLQAYRGFPDLRERVTKDYHAMSKSTLRIVASQAKDQPARLERNDAKELALVTQENPKADKIIERQILELGRLAKKVERVLQTPIKAFFASDDDQLELLWVNRLGFDIIIQEDEPSAGSAARGALGETSVTPAGQSPAAPSRPPQSPATPSAEDFLIQESKSETSGTPEALKIANDGDAENGVGARLLASSLKIVRQIVERKYRSAFGESATLESIAEMISRLNQASAFSRPVDGALLLQAEEAAKSQSNITAAEYAKAVEEVAYLMGYS